METSAKRARMSDGRALLVASPSSSAVAVPSPVAAAVAASAAVPPAQPLSTEMAAVNELMRQHPREAVDMLTVAQTVDAKGPWNQTDRDAGAATQVAAASAAVSALFADKRGFGLWPVASPAAFVRLRDDALVTGVLGGVLSFAPVAERLKAGRVSKQWRVAMMQPSLWPDQGWHLTRHVHKSNALPLPSWLCTRLRIVRCSCDWLLFAAPFERFCQLTNLRHLDLRRSTRVSDMAATEEAALCRYLSGLPLQSLWLPMPYKRSQRMLSVLAQPKLSGHAPSPMMSWSNSLTSFRCEARLLRDDPLLKALSAQPWPLLRKLQLMLHCVELAHTSAALEQVRHLLTCAFMPSLTSLEMGVEIWRIEETQECPCTKWRELLLPSVRGLNTLSFNCSRSRESIEFLKLLRLVSADAMPQLTQLCLDQCDILPLPDDERAAAIALLQHMPLTQLTHITRRRRRSFHLLQHLPHLTMCTFTEDCCAESVATALSLEDLTCSGSAVGPLTERWWRRCGCRPLQHAGFVDEREWQRHLAERAVHPIEAAAADTPTPVIRVLRCGPNAFGMAPIRAWNFPYLAHLPQLRELECCLYPTDLRALGLLTQLTKLRLWLAVNTFWNAPAAMWSNDAVRTLGELPLHHLHSLRLEGNDEHPRMTVTSMQPNDPDFPWEKGFQFESGDVKRASVVPLTLDGLRRLLNLRALTSLHLPWIEPGQLETLRELAEQTGRASLHVERIVPLSRRSLLQRHWIDGATLDDDSY